MTEQIVIRLIDALQQQATKAAGVATRDDREPGVKRKRERDLQLALLLRRIFRRQMRTVQAWLEQMHPERKASDVPDGIEMDDEEIADLIILLQLSAADGIQLFGEAIEIPFDYSLVNARAAAAARTYTYNLVKGIDATSRQALQSAISTFISTPGMTIKEAMSLLPYTAERAALIAVTEITRAYATGELEAAAELKEKYPDVRVTKTWNTNNDERVCEICEPLDGVEIDEDESFGKDVFGEDMPGPAAHPACRCWMSHRTRIEG